MTQPATISADYTLRPSEVAATLALLVEARQPAMLWGGPGTAKSMIAQQVAAAGNRQYVDVRALLLDPVDLRGIPWRDAVRTAPAGRRRPSCRPPTMAGRWLVNLEELPSGRAHGPGGPVPARARPASCGEYELPEGASLIACGNRESDRGVTHRMPTPLASRFVHLEIRVDVPRTGAPGARRTDIAPEVLFFIQMRARRCCTSVRPPVEGEGLSVSEDLGVRLSNIVQQSATVSMPSVRARPVPGGRGRGCRGRVLGLPQGLAGVAPSPGRDRRSRERGHPRQRQRPDRPVRVPLQIGRRHQPRGPSSPIRRERLRREVGEFLVGSCIRRDPDLATQSPAFIQLGRHQDPVNEPPKTWRITHYPPSVAPSRDYAVRAPSLDDARRKLADTLNVPRWTVR